MKCQKCGGQAFDYSADKWHCLQCGRTSKTAADTGGLRTPVTPEPTQYEWDNQHATTPVLRIVKWGKHDPEHFRTAYATNYKAILALNEELQLDKTQEFPALLTALLVSLVSGASVVWLWWFMLQQPGLIWVYIGIGVALVYWVLARWRRWRNVRQRGITTNLQLWKYVQSNARLALQQQEELTLGYELRCPYCAKVFEFTPAAAPPPEGLKRCVSCGQQFHTRRGYSYPVQFRHLNGPGVGDPPPNSWRN